MVSGNKEVLFPFYVVTHGITALKRILIPFYVLGLDIQLNKLRHPMKQIHIYLFVILIAVGGLPE